MHQCSLKNLLCVQSLSQKYTFFFAIVYVVKVLWGLLNMT
uniref:Uncharacterized protein n=1 Tax=Arundo donax TaxID=35708 RepID=A0A0A9A2V7_ARUDO